MQSTTLGLFLDATLKGTVLLLGAGALVVALRRGSAASRHLIWQLALLAVLGLPFIRVITPFQFAVLPRLQSPVVAGDEGVRRSGDQGEKRNIAAPLTSSSPDPLTSQPATASTKVPVSPYRVAGIIWLTIAGALLLRLLTGFVLVRWFALRGYPLYEDGWAELNADLAATMGVKRTVTLLASPHIATPMTWGVIHPVIMMPAAAEDWTMERRRVVMLHELAHIRRRDSLTHMFAQAACALYWFHPLVWKAAARMRAEAERACDDLVLRAGTKASVYADHLLELIRTIGGMRTPALALPMAQRSTFEGRLLAILEPHLDRTAPRPLSVASMLLVGAFIVFPLAGLTTASALPMNVNDASESPIRMKPVVSLKHSQKMIEQAALQAQTQTQTVTNANVVNQSGMIQATSGAVNALIVALRDEDADVRASSAQALGQLEDSSAVAALAKALREDSDARVRKAAAWALGQIESRAATPALIYALQNDKDAEVRATSVWALGQLEDKSAVPALVQVLKSADVDMRKEAVWALGQIEDRSAVPGIIAVLRDENADVRNQAVWALGQIEDASAVSALTSLLSDSNPEVRKQVAWALGQIEDESAVNALESTLRRDADADVRKQAAWALGQIEPHPLPRALIDALKDKDVEVRQTAAWAISQIDDPSAQDALVEMLKDSNPEIRRAAAKALGGGNVNPQPQPRPQPRPRPIN